MIAKSVVGAVVLSLAVGVSSGFAQGREKGWLDVNIGAATAAEESFTSTRVVTIAQEAGGGSAAYGVPRGGAFDIGGGYMFSSRIGLGVSLAGTAHEDIAGLAVSVPHPLYFNSSATASDVTDGALTRTEGAWHLHGMVVLASTPRFRLRAFGGPSYFRAEQEVVDAIEYSQVFQVLGRGNIVDITTFSTDKSTGTAWGYHAGGDLSVFFNRIVGIGTSVRVSRGTTEIADYGGTHDIKLGGVQANIGLRLKF